MKMGAQRGDTKAFGLVRDKDGKPKVNKDISKIPQQIWDMLTPEEQEELQNGQKYRTRSSTEK